MDWKHKMLVKYGTCSEHRRYGSSAGYQYDRAQTSLHKIFRVSQYWDHRMLQQQPSDGGGKAGRLADLARALKTVPSAQAYHFRFAVSPASSYSFLQGAVCRTTKPRCHLLSQLYWGAPPPPQFDRQSPIHQGQED